MSIPRRNLPAAGPRPGVDVAQVEAGKGRPVAFQER